MADTKPKAKATPDTPPDTPPDAEANICITPLGLNPTAHLHTSVGRLGMGCSRDVPAAEAEQYIEAGRAKVAGDEPTFVDEPRVLAGLDA